MGEHTADIGLVKLTRVVSHAACWAVIAVKGSTTEHLELVTAANAQDLVDDAGTYGSWATTADGILGIWDALSSNDRQALHDNCEGQQ